MKYKSISNILSIALKDSSDGMIVTDLNNNIIEVNQSFLKIFGYREESEVIGKNPRILASGKQDQTFYENMWKMILEEKHWSGKIWNKRTNGDIFLESSSITAVVDDQGQIQNYLAVFSDLSELKKAKEKLFNLAYYDQLTGLPNRQKIIMDLSTNEPDACIVFNIDNFKEINGFFGISSGDSIIQQLAEWFTEIGCSPYRIGGDEFAVLFYGKVVWEELSVHIQSLLLKFDEKRFSIGDEILNLHLTAGVAIGKSKLLTRADIALHEARENKTSIALYGARDNMEALYRNNIALAETIRQALKDDRIICLYQPIVDMNTGSIDRYETLVRLVDSHGNMLSPMDFLPVAKKTKLYPQITQSVLHQACALFSTRRENFSINLSVSDIRNPETVQDIIDTITDTKTASRIIFEILESEGIENYTVVTDFIAKVKTLGAKIAIDDFGTGYSNFENILKLGVDYIKIDGSLIRAIATNDRHRIIVETIAEFSRKIGAKTIAEFVSSKEIYDVVKNHGIDYSQGYYSGKPDVL